MRNEILDIFVDVSFDCVSVDIDSMGPEDGIVVLQIYNQFGVGLENVIFICVLKIVFDIEVMQLILDEVDVSFLPVLLIILLEIEHFIQGVGVEPGVLGASVIRILQMLELVWVVIYFGQDSLWVLSLEFPGFCALLYAFLFAFKCS